MKWIFIQMFHWLSSHDIPLSLFKNNYIKGNLEKLSYDGINYDYSYIHDGDIVYVGLKYFYGKKYFAQYKNKPSTNLIISEWIDMIPSDYEVTNKEVKFEKIGAKAIKIWLK